ncbi:MAG: hypothetical protein AAFV51_00510 [Pseudomonadota bacterium]
MMRNASIIGLLLLGACATTQAPQIARGGDEPVLRAIAPGGLKSGSCGALLWTRGVSGDPALIFRSNAAEGAEVNFNGVLVPLALREGRGVSIYGQQLEQTFVPLAEDAPKIIVHVEAETGPSFDGGVYTRNARITLARDDGWEVVTPVAGVIGCSR